MASTQTLRRVAGEGGLMGGEGSAAKVVLFILGVLLIGVTLRACSDVIKEDQARRAAASAASRSDSQGQSESPAGQSSNDEIRVGDGGGSQDRPQISSDGRQQDSTPSVENVETNSTQAEGTIQQRSPQAERPREVELNAEQLRRIYAAHILSGDKQLSKGDKEIVKILIDNLEKACYPPTIDKTTGQVVLPREKWCRTYVPWATRGDGGSSSSITISQADGSRADGSGAVANSPQPQRKGRKGKVEDP
jgi:hypothetical protein